MSREIAAHMFEVTSGRFGCLESHEADIDGFLTEVIDLRSGLVQALPDKVRPDNLHIDGPAISPTFSAKGPLPEEPECVAQVAYCAVNHDAGLAVQVVQARSWRAYSGRDEPAISRLREYTERGFRWLSVWERKRAQAIASLVLQDSPLSTLSVQIVDAAHPADVPMSSSAPGTSLPREARASTAELVPIDYRELAFEARHRVGQQMGHVVEGLVAAERSQVIHAKLGWLAETASVLSEAEQIVAGGSWLEGAPTDIAQVRELLLSPGS